MFLQRCVALCCELPRVTSNFKPIGFYAVLDAVAVS